MYKDKKLIIYLLVICSALAGCAPPIPLYIKQSKLIQDVKKDQPWLSSGDQASAYITYIVYSLGYSERWLEWTNKDGVTLAKGHKVIDRCKIYLKSVGWWHRLRGEGLENFERVRGRGGLDIMLENIPGKFMVRPARNEYALGNANPASIRKGFEDVWVIVCIEPVIAIQGPSAIHNVDMPGASRDINLEAPRTATFFLPYGFSYGTTLPYSDDPIWFSPDMKMGPASADYVDTDTREIRVSWGKLILIRDSNSWKVIAQKE